MTSGALLLSPVCWSFRCWHPIANPPLVVVVLAAVRCCAIGVHEEACVTVGWLDLRPTPTLAALAPRPSLRTRGRPSCVRSCETLHTSRRLGSHWPSALFPGTWNTLALSEDACNKIWLWSHQFCCPLQWCCEYIDKHEAPTHAESCELPVFVAHFSLAKIRGERSTQLTQPHEGGLSILVTTGDRNFGNPEFGGWRLRVVLTPQNNGFCHRASAGEWPLQLIPRWKVCHGLSKSGGKFSIDL